MPTYQLQCSLFIPRSLPEVFRVFEDPYNLARITPPWLRFQVTSKEKVEMARDVRIDYVIRWLGLPMRWRTRITRYAPPHLFVDEQERGPYVLWRHTHTFTEVDGGVLVADSVDYRLPFGPLGVLAHRALVRAQLLGIFRYRQQATAAIFGVALDQRQEPRIRRLAERGSAIPQAS